ncbi:hypothetical protein AB1Y20_016988 [Prymnesium parvum]|uniref:PROP1-like PPR domain-containing protein n=1 Tax=Prymnesium parvum TaxID=97485 RepID=A0AB34I7K7_PRYPA
MLRRPLARLAFAAAPRLSLHAFARPRLPLPSAAPALRRLSQQVSDATAPAAASAEPEHAAATPPPAAADSAAAEPEVSASAAASPPAAAAAEAADAAEGAPPPEVASEAEEGAPLASVPTVASFQTPMEKSAKANDYARVLSLYEEMISQGVPPNSGIFDLYLEAKSKTDGVQAGIEALRILSSQYPNVRVNASAYSALISSCAETKDKDTAVSLYKTMVDAGITPTRDVFNTLMSVHVAAADFDGADSIFKQMRELDMSPLQGTYLAYIYGCMGADDPDRVYSMLQMAEAQWRIPTSRAYEHMLKFFGRRRHLEGQLRCVRAILEDRMDIAKQTKSDDISLTDDLRKQINVSLSVLLRNARERNDTDVLLELQKLANLTGARLNSHQQAAVVFNCLKQGKTLEAFEKAVDQLRARDTSLPIKASEWLASSLSKTPSLVDDAYFRLESDKKKGLAVPLGAINIIIDACAMMGDLDRAFATWAELEQLGLKPNTGTYNALVHACIRTREVASGRRLIARMEMEEVPPDAVTYSHRCALLLQSRAGDAAVGLLEECKQKGLRPRSHMYVSCINFLLRAKQYSKARELLEEMRGSDVFVTDKYIERVEAEIAANA